MGLPCAGLLSLPLGSGQQEARGRGCGGVAAVGGGRAGKREIGIDAAFFSYWKANLKFKERVLNGDSD